jgi:3-oxoadipate enol-lactonase
MPFARVNGSDLYYEVHGQGPPVVFSHGLGGNHLCWWNQVPAFRDRYTIVTYDLRSFGQSTDDGREKVDLASDLEGLIDHLGFEKVVVFGQSLGGFAAGGFAARRPERVLALALSSSAGGFAAIKPPAADAGDIRKALSSYANLVQYTLRQDNFARRDPTMFFLYEQIAGMNTKVNPLRALGMGAHNEDPGPLIERRIPLLIMEGDEDPPHVRGAIAQVIARAPHAQHLVIPHAGHLTFFEQPALFNGHLRTFLDAHV